MNKRLIKKMMKKKEEFKSFVYAEGNNGGDFIQIENHKDGMIHLCAGSSCVMAIDNIVPVEFLSGIINQVMLLNNGDINSVIDSFGWSHEYKEELKKKVQ